MNEDDLVQPPLYFHHEHVKKNKTNLCVKRTKTNDSDFRATKHHLKSASLQYTHQAMDKMMLWVQVQALVEENKDLKKRIERLESKE